VFSYSTSSRASSPCITWQITAGNHWLESAICVSTMSPAANDLTGGAAECPRGEVVRQVYTYTHAQMPVSLGMTHTLQHSSKMGQLAGENLYDCVHDFSVHHTSSCSTRATARTGLFLAHTSNGWALDESM
jgi:hypothetical protein